jgi:hypothetical protein
LMPLRDTGDPETLGPVVRGEIDRGIRLMDHFVSFAEEEWPVDMRKNSMALKPRHFNGAIPMDGLLYDGVVSPSIRNLCGGEMYASEVRPDMLGAFDIRGFRTVEGNASEIVFHRMTNTSPRDWRGRIGAVAPQMVRVQSAWMSHEVQSVDEDGAWVWQDVEAIEYPMGRWHDYESWRCLDVKRTPPEFKDLAFALMAFALCQHYLWRVQFRDPDNRLGISLPVTHADLSSLFATREVDLGKDRKAALQHWVSGHWRKLPPTGDYETMVREHLRGTLDFEWHGFGCRIMPATNDQWRDIQNQMQRHMAKRDGLDRRRAEK